MLLKDLIDVNLLNQHIQDGLVSERLHPDFPLKILNYTPEAAFSGTWDSVTKLCRGLIVEVPSERIMARPFSKFFNLNTAGILETEEGNLPKELPLVTEKADGSLGVGFYYADKWYIATRGSFSSDQASWANNWYDVRCKLQIPFDWPNGYTPVFEIIYKENRIVVDYGGFEGLVLLGLVEIATGQEIGRDELERWGGENHVPVIKKFNKTLLECVAENLTNFEGYVLTYPNGLKIKLKQENYLVLHRIVTGMNARSVWELLSTGKDFTQFESMPEQFQRWLKCWVKDLNSQHDNIFTTCQDFYKQCPSIDTEIEPYRDYRKRFALWVQSETPKEFHSVMFAMLDNQDPNPVIWKMIKPRGDDQTFRTESE